MAYPYLTISSQINSLNSGSFYTESDLSTIKASQSSDIFFGTTEQDSIEFSAYDINGNQLVWNI